MRFFALDSSRSLAEKVALVLGRDPDPHEERRFEDGECKIRPLVSVRDEDTYVLHTLVSDEAESVHDKLCKLIFLIAALNDAGARRVTAVIPYLCYARKDRQTKLRDPLTLRYVATVLESVGLDRVVTLEVHNEQAFQNAFRINTEHIRVHRNFIDFIRYNIGSKTRLVVMSPDIGGVKRAEQFRKLFERELGVETGFAFMQKTRSRDVVSGHLLVGEVKEAVVVIVDDLVSTGTTLVRCAATCKEAGAIEVDAFATHAVLSRAAPGNLVNGLLDRLVVTNTIQLAPGVEAELGDKLVMLDVSKTIGEVILHLARAESLAEWKNLED